MRMLCTILLVDGILQSTEEPLAVYDRIVSSWLDFPVQLSSSMMMQISFHLILTQSNERLSLFLCLN